MSSTRFDPPVPTLEELTGVSDITAPDGDGTLIPGENDFSSSSNKPTLRSYISSLTRGLTPTDGIVEYNGPTPPPHANPFPVSVRNDDQQKFTDQEGLRDAVDLGNEPSQIFGDIEGIIKQGSLGSANSTVAGTGHELLPGVVGSRQVLPNLPSNTLTTTPGARAYARTLGEALARKNLYSAEVFVDNDMVSSDRSYVPTGAGADSQTNENVSSRVRLGDSSLGTSYDVSSAKFVNPSDLSEIGRRLMIKAMGEDPDAEPSKWTNGPNARSRVNVNDIRVAAAAQGTDLSDLNMTMSKAGQDSVINDDGVGNTDGGYSGSSWPSAFTPDTPYTGATSGQAAFGAFVIAGVFTGIVLAIAAVLTPTVQPASIPAEINVGSSQPDLNKKIKLGAFRFEPAGNLAQALNVIGAISDVTGITLQSPIYVPTNPSVGYGECVVAGLAYFLGVTLGLDVSPGMIVKSGGFSASGNTAILLAAIATRLAVIYAEPVSRQYYMNVIRMLNRNAVALGAQIRDDLGQVVADATLASLGIGAIPSIFDSKIFKFVDTLAKIGDLAYTQANAIYYRGTDLETSPQSVYESFDFHDNGTSVRKATARGFAARRVYGDRIKGRRGSTISLADLPSMHLIPSGEKQDYERLLGGSQVASRIKSVKITSTGENNGKKQKRFSPEQVKAIESVLDAEYMPFYFQDLRTNEIVSFHAFLESLTDSYNAEYNSVSGYGRVEDIKSYKSTKRAVSVEFNVVSMNPQDFDYMWWQINKLTSMVYPQWSQGRQLQDESGFKFTQPFSQIPTATPVIRVRVGDLIRSNYSRFNLKRLFGRQDVDNIESQTGQFIPIEFEDSYRVRAGQSYVCGRAGQKIQEITLPNTNDLGDQIVWIDVTKKQGVDGEFYYEVTDAFVPEIIGLNVWVDEASGNLQVYTNTVINETPESSEKRFYDYNQNSIVRSFESTAGMGLAVVVSQLQFTWMDTNTTWGVGEDGPGNRAPRSCKVQMTFEPIHDIAPGLDHDGFNRAPIYPVGNLVNSIVEGGESEPYGIGSKSIITSADEIKSDTASYKESLKPGILSKLF